MIAGILLILLGESALFESVYLFAWFLVFFVINHFYISLVEEPKLIKRFGEDYSKYMKSVPRWLPLLRIKRM
jgi:protein-S-isoprenylcysteine O-methyltransferase Ste14